MLGSLFDEVTGLNEADEATCRALETLFEVDEAAAYNAAKAARAEDDDGTFAYGEIVISGFVSLLREELGRVEKATGEALETDPRPRKAFWDLGSGAGKAVLAAHCCLPDFER